MIQDTIERIYINSSTFGEINRGVFIVRGENVVYVGEIDEQREEQEDSCIVDSTLEEADLEPFPKIHPGMSPEERAQIQQKLRDRIERNPKTNAPIIRRIPYEEAKKIHDKLNDATKDEFIKRSKTIPNEKFTDKTELLKY